MCVVKHGAVILADVPYQPENPHSHSGTHFYAVVSNQASCKYSPVVNVVPLTSRCFKKRNLPTHVDLKADFLPKASVGLAEQLTLMSKDLLENGKCFGILEDEAMEDLKNAIKVQLALA